MTFEGIDGSGKTTVSRLVAEILRKRGHSVFLTGEPTKSWLGGAVRRAVDDDVGAIAESLLFFADRAVHVGEIRAHLAKGEVVLCDRYADSTYAYQGARLDRIIPDPVRFLQRIGQGWMPSPDLTILLRVPPELGVERIKGRRKRVRFEDVSFLRRVAANYDRLARSRRFSVIDGAQPKELVAKAAVATIERRVNARRGR